MIILALTTDKLSLISSSTSALDVVASFVDRDQSTGVVGLANKQLTAITTAATTDIVAVPGATTTRNVKTINIRNKGAAANDVTIQFNANGTLYELHKTTLQAGESLQYIEGAKFFKLERETRLDRTMVVTSDVLNNAAGPAWADITGLTCPMLSGVTYNFLAVLFHVSGVTTTGAQFAYNIGAAPTIAQIGMIDTILNSVTAATMAAGTALTRDTAAIVETTGAATDAMGIISGFIVPSADGTFALRLQPEVASASLTVKRGSWLRVWTPTP